MTVPTKIVTRDTYASEVLNAPKPVIVDVGAPWCGPCKVFSPVLRTLAAAAHDSFAIAAVNIVDFPEFKKRYRISALPCFVLIVNGQELSRLSEPATQADLISWIELTLPK